MTRFPAARCHTCDEWLSPEGQTNLAREAMKNHVDNRIVFEGRQHLVAIYSSRDEYEEMNPASQ